MRRRSRRTWWGVQVVSGVLFALWLIVMLSQDHGRSWWGIGLAGLSLLVTVAEAVQNRHLVRKTDDPAVDEATTQDPCKG